jgi:ATP phosphoribosyltransferase regulatory subunit
MTSTKNWLLPDGVQETLPDDALKLEMRRRRILDSMVAKGYQLVMPPIMEFVDALLTGTGEELDTQTYKFMDQHTQRMLGIRADMTPQIARIDAHYLSDNEVNRLCYAGTVLRTQPSVMGGPRELLQIGAELFGIADVQGDIDVVSTMIESLDLADLPSVTLNLGHVGIYRALKAGEGIDEALEKQIFDILLRKSSPDMQALIEQNDIPELDYLLALLSMNGDSAELAGFRAQLPNAGAQGQAIDEAVDELEQVASFVEKQFPKINLHIDLADVLGYRYHTGLKFSVYASGEGRAIAKGGRYDRVGEQFGRARPATGFSADLKSLLDLSK